MGARPGPSLRRARRRPSGRQGNGHDHGVGQPRPGLGRRSPSTPTTAVAGSAPRCWRSWSTWPRPQGGRSSASTAGTPRHRAGSRSGSGSRSGPGRSTGVSTSKELSLDQLRSKYDEALPHASSYELLRLVRPHVGGAAAGRLRDVGRDQRRAPRRPRHRGRGLPSSADPRLRGGDAAARSPAAPGPGAPPCDRRAGRPHCRGGGGGTALDRRTSTTPRWSGRTAVTGWGCS